MLSKNSGNKESLFCITQHNFYNISFAKTKALFVQTKALFVQIQVLSPGDKTYLPGFAIFSSTEDKLRDLEVCSSQRQKSTIAIRIKYTCLLTFDI